MTVKKEYAINDDAWVYGINSKTNRPVKGKVIKIVDLKDAGYTFGPHYVVEIPTHIDPLLEIRTWESMSQDEKGPVGALRGIKELVSTIKKAKTIGFAFDDEYDDDGPTADEIHAALEKSQTDVKHGPLIIKENRPKRKHYTRKKNG